jgi:TusE/DsrC/DsvC family sulfur relay protein
MAEKDLSETKIHLDDEGYLIDPDEWNESVANALAKNEGIDVLDKEKLDILKFVRGYYKRYNYFPILNAVCKNVHQPKNCINEAFMNPIKAWKLAGLPKPDENIISILQYGQTPG